MPTVSITTAGATQPSGSPTRSELPATMIQLGFGFTQVFTFEYAPLEIRFEDLASSYQEINRPGKYPLLQFDALKLTKAVIEFRLASRASGGNAPVEWSMNLLRSMATFPGPVYFTGGVDRLLIQPLQPVESRAIAYWRITDMAFNVKRRDTMNRATQVDVSMTLTEERNPSIPLTILPTITYSDSPSRRRPGAATSGSSGSNNGGGGNTGGGRPGGTTFTDNSPI